MFLPHSWKEWAYCDHLVNESCYSTTILFNIKTGKQPPASARSCCALAAFFQEELSMQEVHSVAISMGVQHVLELKGKHQIRIRDLFMPPEYLVSFGSYWDKEHKHARSALNSPNTILYRTVYAKREENKTVLKCQLKCSHWGKRSNHYYVLF